jgi:SAM-dependent methyltransferase
MRLMSLDIVDLREFYINPLGQTVSHFLRSHLRRIWPDVRGQTVLALGYATPLLRPWLDTAKSIFVMMPAEHGVAYWPREGPNKACLTDLTALPLPDESVDRVVVVHALEAGNDPDSLLREVWRVLKANGQALFIVPNRRGFWAHSDRTPFGTGRPYSAFQLKDALRDQGFLVERSCRALFMPPSQTRLALALSYPVERVAGWLFPGFGGLLVMEASKQIFGAILTKSRTPNRRLVMPLPFNVPSGPVPAGRNY